MLKRKVAAATDVGPSIATDPVTDLPDRTNLEPWLLAAVRNALATSSRVCLSVLELGRFEDISDTYGADAADDVIGTIARRLATVLEWNQQICRNYREEFVVVTPDINSVERAHEVTMRLLDVLSAPVSIGQAQVSAFTSAGVALSDSGYGGVKDWLHDAHTALTEAREEGHRACVVHDEATRNRIDVRITPERVIKGWAESEFDVKYQPVVHTADGRIAGFEALLRWRDPGASGTFIRPEYFVQLLEQTGLMVPVGSWMLKEACSKMKLWTEMFPDRGPMFVTVNLGARQISDDGFAESVVEALETAQLPPEQLVLDITEASLRFNRASTWRCVRNLKALDIKLSLDDFGTGEAGINYLRDLQLDFVSIHRSFMQGVGRTKEDLAIVRALVDLARELGIATVAEGVENRQQDETTKGIGPDYIQGYFYGEPELPEVVEELLKKGPKIVGSEDWMGRTREDGETPSK